MSIGDGAFRILIGLRVRFDISPSGQNGLGSLKGDEAKRDGGGEQLAVEMVVGALELLVGLQGGRCSGRRSHLWILQYRRRAYKKGHWGWLFMS